VETRVLRPVARTVDVPTHRALSSDSRAGILALIGASDTGLTAAEIARESGLHPSTVRAHLDRLVEAELVVREPARDGTPGRPSWRYRAVPSPEPGGGLYRQLAGALIGHLTVVERDAAAAGEQAGREWGRQLAQDLQAVGPHTIRRRGRAPIDSLLELLSQLGFTPRLARRDGNAAGVVHLTTCPFLDLVAKYPDVVCALHRGVIRGALNGMGASVDAQLRPFAVDGACVVQIKAAARAA
jgi:predicted ArsR family transcriptional regulator